ncbi:nucleotidyl transferase AbiEii/AbiGii toxin family protein [Streptomyces sp. NBC_00576]|uniref:nucleotidyl transferase AbiEii/AbiGii toxin family protein n=1 Tax=Streptomyces sp. NBC_00576 TaxID=2903665 RepID=UPI002E81CE77|nr:nucleotidyl transferase AbiEii/AbiGii toxin family protein [Streptomyces sp. NBC_00576]WUB74592.1 nucleotidyl transferase AbiEii/AbiGii toxin family protein [Streptomyces sp. NBC_00576]
MSNNWTWRERVWAGLDAPKDGLDDRTRETQGLPLTLRTVPGRDVVQRLVFEPALKQHHNAYRAADPGFADPARGEAWRVARRRALELVLDAIAGSEWAQALVLRGSVLMAAWFGEAAREPGDLDFVVVPDTFAITDARAGRMLAGIAAAAEADGNSEVGFSARDAVIEDIWTYDRVPGRRMVLPWSAPGLPGGHVQLDFVFNERLAEPPVPVELPGGTLVWAATPALSLAWKLMWLINDMYAQGKDLYDAVLLAERYPLPHELLHEVFRLSGEWPHAEREHILLADVVQAVGYVEWDHFVVEYPQLADREREFVDRLVRAVTPAFDGERL